MGAFTLLLDSQGPDYQDLESRQLEAMTAQGFSAPTKLVAGSNVLFAYPKLVASTVNFHVFADGDFVAVFGTFFYRGKTGSRGLEAIYTDLKIPTAGSNPTVNEHVPGLMRGTYACVVYKSRQFYFFTDRLGLYKVYLAESGRVVTSSLLTAVACSKQPRLSPQGVFEYVFQGATYGGETTVSGISLLDADRQLLISQGVKHLLPRAPLAPAEFEKGSLTDHCERIHMQLGSLFDECSESFAGKIDTALSGGYDSRLILAHLLDKHEAPAVHVYGRESDDDVRIAKLIADKEGFQLAHIDKSRFRKKLGAEELSIAAEENFYAFDGLPVDGIFDNGTDLATRRDRARDGRLSLNGGGGEIFRNFFYLRDRPYTAREVVAAFYSQFNPDSFAAEWDPEQYSLLLAEKIGKCLAVTGRPLSRAEVERVFPLFRCRYWMGKNNSVNNRLGHMHTPFVEPSLVEYAGAVPISIKDCGRLAGCLIKKASPKLAAYPSAYGYAFDQDVPTIHLVKYWLSSHRTPKLRRLAFPLRTRLKRTSLNQEKRGIVLLMAEIGVEIAQTRSIIPFDRILDPAQVRRLLTLEYFCRKTGTSA